MLTDINSYLAQNGHRFWAHPIGPRARALYFEIFSGIVSQQSFGHLAGCRIASPENQHSLFLRARFWGHKSLPTERPVKDTVSSERPAHTAGATASNRGAGGFTCSHHRSTVLLFGPRLGRTRNCPRYKYQQCSRYV